jgi:hypothetical protein
VKVCVSVDLDNYAEYERLLSSARSGPDASLYFGAVPRFLDLFDRCGIRGTFFVIGRDARRADHRAMVREVAARGHEVGNHSYSHPHNFRSLSRERKIEEIEQGESALADILGERPVGFRTPSCDVDLETLHLLAERGYAYDSSVLPSWMMWAFMLYGKVFVRRDDYQLGELLAPLAPPRPYRPHPERLHREAPSHRDDAPDILEIPCSAVPVVRLLFYGTFLRLLPPRIFDWCVRAHPPRQPLIMLLHLLDLADLGVEALNEGMRRTPGIGVSFERRQRFVERAMTTLGGAGTAVPMREVARELAAARAA